MKTDVNIVKHTAIHKAMKEISDINVSSDASEKMKNALNYLGLAIIESAHINALLSGRKTLLEQDVDIALESLYNYSEAWDRIFAPPDDASYQEDDFSLI